MEEVPLIRLPFPTMEGHLFLREVRGAQTRCLAFQPVGWGPLPLGFIPRYTRKKHSFLNACPTQNLRWSRIYPFLNF